MTTILITQMNQHRRLLAGLLSQIYFTANSLIIVINRHDIYTNVTNPIYATNQLLSKQTHLLSNKTDH